MASLELLPYELLIRIALHLKAGDLCQLSLVSRYFSLLMRDGNLWFQLSRGKFPLLQFSSCQVHRPKLMYRTLLQHQKLLGLWLNKNMGVMHIKITKSGIIGQAIRVFSEGFGQYPFLVTTDKLKLNWNAEAGAFENPIFFPGGGWVCCYLNFTSHYILVRERTGPFSTSILEKFDKFYCTVTPQSSVRLCHGNVTNFLNPGLFASCSGRSACPLVLATYSTNSRHLIVRNLRGGDTIGTESVNIAVSKLCGVSAIFHREDPFSYYFSDSSELCSRHFDKKPIPERLDSLSGGVLRRLSSTYRAVFPCLVKSVFDTGRLFTSSGFCCIINKNLFTLYDSTLGRFRLYYRLDPILMGNQ